MMCSGAECLKSELSKEDSWDSGSTFGSLLTESEFGGGHLTCLYLSILVFMKPALF